MTRRYEKNTFFGRGWTPFNIRMAFGKHAVQSDLYRQCLPTQKAGRDSLSAEG
jgi:hypothetical protein